MEIISKGSADMKKLILVTILVSLIILGNPVLAEDTSQLKEKPRPNTTSNTIPGSVIDDILVPYDVLEYAQLQYQGYAITYVKKIIKDGKEVYSAQVNRDDSNLTHDGYILYYDMHWKLIEEGKYEAPVVTKPAATLPTEPTIDTLNPQPTPELNTVPSLDSEDEPNGGGRGGGYDESVPEPEQENTPTNKPKPRSTDD